METGLSGGAPAVVGTYPDSVDSSPRSRGGESWDDPFPSSTVPAKLRFMCSYGGQIVPRPHDKSLCYLGGDTRIVVVDRHTTLADLTAKLSRSLLGGRPFSLKYQLPSEELDSLISVSTDEDLDNMIEEYDRILNSNSHGGSGAAAGNSSNSNRTPRLRLFIFPSKPESSSSVGSLLDDSKSETWFVDALNNAIGMGGVLPRGLSADSNASSVNCLLGLEEDRNHSVHSAAPVAANSAAPDQVEQHRLQMHLPHQDSSGKLVPDSAMLDTSSSFGSTSSAPSPSNLPPIRVRPDNRVADHRSAGGGLEEQFAQMNISGQKQQEDGNFAAFQHQHPPPPLNTVPLSATSTVSPTENPNQGGRASDDEKSDHDWTRKPYQPPVQPQQQISDRHMNYAERISPGASGMNTVSDPKLEGQYLSPDANYRVQMQVSEQGYMMPIPPEQLQQQQQQQQQQYVHANPHLVHHHTSTPVMPIQSYYQMQHPIHTSQQLPQPHPYNQQIPMYFMPVRQNPSYTTIPMQQPNLGDAPPYPSSTKPTIPLPTQVLSPQSVAPPKPESTAPPSIYRTSAAAAVAPPPPAHQLIHLTDQSHQYMGYHPVHHHPSQAAAATAAATTGYGYEFTDSVQSQPVYYTQASSAVPLPPQYQTMSSAAVISEIHPQLQQTADVKQARAS